MTQEEKQRQLDFLIIEFKTFEEGDPRIQYALEEIEELAKEIMDVPYGAVIISINSAA
jgi:hypothetical protein